MIRKFFQWLLPKEWMTIKHKHVCEHNYIDVKKLNPADNIFRVVEVDPSKSKLTEGLGISPERKEKLQNLCIDSLKNASNTVTAMRMIGPELKHANELYYCSVYVHTAVGKIGNGHGDQFQDFLKQIFKDRP